jgi:class 3 adenylate cyclase
MARLQRRRFSEPDEVRTMPNGTVDVVSLDDRIIGRMTYQPGWRWSVDVKPIAGTQSCQFHHVGVTISGRLRVATADGLELEVGPGDVFEFPPGHDAWVIGDVPWVSVDFEAMRTYARASTGSGRRTLATILMTDIVDSTARAVSMGSARWRDVVGRHNELAEKVIDRHEGHLIKTTGDGVIAVFDSAELAVAAAGVLTRSVQDLDLHIRAGVHTGEVEPGATDVRGLAVHTAARIMAVAGSDEVLVSATVRELLEGADLAFEDRGSHDLKGIAGSRQLYRFLPATPTATASIAGAD